MKTGDVLETALRYARAGLSVLPVRSDGSKAPALKTWEPLQKRLPTEDEIREWFGNGARRGVAVVCGAVSGGLYALDLDDLTIAEAFITELLAYDTELLFAMPECRTPRPGKRLFFRYDGELHSSVLAYRVDADGRKREAIALIGDGKYSIVPPTPAECHENRKPYEWVRGDLTSVPTLSDEQLEDVFALARLFDEAPKPEAAPMRVTAEARRVGDVYNEQADVLELLQRHGWRLAGGRGENVYLTRPGKQRGVSATWNENLRVFYCFSTNAEPFQAGHGYSPFSIYAMLECAGDFHEAARRLAKQYGTEPIATSGGVVEWLRQHALTFAQLDSMDFPEPEWCVEGVIPAVGLTMLAGKKSLGKSWAALELALNLAQGLPVWGLPVTRPRKTVYLALEDSERRLKKRRQLASLTTSENALVFTKWLPPEAGGREALRELVRTFGAECVIIDTLSAWRTLGKPNGGAGKNIWLEEHALTREFQQLAMELEIAIVLCHHRNKSGSEDVDAIAGTGGLSAPVDTVILASRVRGEADGTFRVFGRDVEERDFAVSFAGNRWTVMGDAREYAVSTERRKILDALREAGEATPREIADLTGLPYGSVKHLLRRMANAGQLRTRNGKYSVANGESGGNDSPHSPFTHSPVNAVNGERGERGERNIPTFHHSPVNSEHQPTNTHTREILDFGG